MRKILMTLVMVAAVGGCVSKKRYDELALQQQQLGEQKDSLVADVLATTQMMTEINSDLAAVHGLGVSPASSTGDRPLTGKAEDRSITLGKIREVISRLDAAEKQVAAQKTRISSLSSSTQALKDERIKLGAQLDSLSKTLEDMKTAAEQQEATITQQKAQIQTLSARTDTLTQQTAALTTVNAAVTDTLTHVVNEENTVYYAVGTKDELIKRGILVDEGSKFLVFGGKTLQPARDLKPELFQRLDRRRDTVLTVPEPTKEYKIVTRQDPKTLTANLQPDGKLKGDLHVSSPTFWDAGRYLILVRD
jgi:outer membrane murein-binding lipoprotein Lpp